MARLAPYGTFRAFDEDGDPLAGGKLHTYEAGTSTPKVTYTTEDESTGNQNPVILDANGYADVWLGSGSYKFVLDDAADVNQFTIDDIIGSGALGYASTVVSQATNLTVTSAFQDNLIVCTAAITLSLLPVATAQEGFVIIVKNESDGDVTIDPDGAELIDGSSTLVLPKGSSGNIVCDGSEWVSFLVTPAKPSGTTLQRIYTADTSSALFSTSTKAVYATVTGQTETITPTETASVVAGRFEFDLRYVTTGGSGTQTTMCDLRIVRNVGVDDIVVREVKNVLSLLADSASSDVGTIISVGFQDAPATTSATSYTVQVRPNNFGAGSADLSSQAKSASNVATRELLELTV